MKKEEIQTHKTGSKFYLIYFGAISILLFIILGSSGSEKIKTFNNYVNDHQFNIAGYVFYSVMMIFAVLTIYFLIRSKKEVKIKWKSLIIECLTLILIGNGIMFLIKYLSKPFNYTYFDDNSIGISAVVFIVIGIFYFKHLKNRQEIALKKKKSSF